MTKKPAGQTVKLLESALADALAARESGVLGGPSLESLSAQEDLAWAFHAAHEADAAAAVREFVRVAPVVTMPRAVEFVDVEAA